MRAIVVKPRAALSRLSHSETGLGLVVVLAAVLLLAATTVLYLRPVGQRTVVFETTDASAISPGLEVRVAGITVGKVTAVTLGASAVTVETRVAEDTFVGRDSRVEVRMLTPVGGYAVTLIPLGDTPLGNNPIPSAQVTVPYSIGDVLQAAPQVTEHVDGALADADIEQVAAALEHNTTSMSSLISGMSSIAAVMDRQRAQVREITGLASEYLRTFEADREFVFDLIRQVDIVLSTYNNTHVGFNEAYRLLGEVLMRIQPIEKYYLDHRQEVLDAADQVRTAIADFRTHMGPAIDQLLALREQLAAWLTPEGLATVQGGSLLASDICLPLPGRTC
ncbi:MlaD family protein [Nocardia barduliensis]|uniref:MlaD family protein n=1 Tax=Nocardia barduliensis TaxID=2736643 RepID=UPI0015722B3C|nr:MlaD family protein [Nocardia barduliensis]